MIASFLNISKKVPHFDKKNAREAKSARNTNICYILFVSVFVGYDMQDRLNNMFISPHTNIWENFGAKFSIYITKE